MPNNDDFQFHDNTSSGLPDDIHMDVKDGKPQYFQGDKTKIDKLTEMVNQLLKRVQILEAQVRTLKRPDPSSLIVGENPDAIADRIIADYLRRNKQ